MSNLTAQDIAEEDKLLVQQHVGSALCSLYDDTVIQPLPDNILMLLKILEATEQRRSECRRFHIRLAANSTSLGSLSTPPFSPMIARASFKASRVVSHSASASNNAARASAVSGTLCVNLGFCDMACIPWY